MAASRIVKLTRHRALPNAGGHTLHFHFPQGKSGRFLRPHQVPEFDGDEAWFEVETIKGVTRVIRRVTERGEPV